MPCASYIDPRLAAVYDTLNPPDESYAFYLELAGREPRTVLDMGCGTGRLACALSTHGHLVTAADPARAMLEIGRKRSEGDQVIWIDSDAATLKLATRFDLIIMTGNVFQVFLTDEDVLAALATLRKHLAPGGRLAFETRNALVAEWREWIPELTRERLEVPGLGSVEVHYDIRATEGPLVTFETHFNFGEDRIVAPHTLRFMEQPELAGFLTQAGFSHVMWYGDWNRSPFGAESAEIIAIAGD